MAMLPALAGPVLLAEIEAPLLRETDRPAVRVTLPPVPESRSVPIVRLSIPAGWPLLNVPLTAMVSRALTLMFPPCPVLLVPLLIWAPLPMVSDPVDRET